MTQLAISILVHEDFTYIYDALNSIRIATQTPHEITIVINKGSQEEIDKLQAIFPDAHYIINQVPQGFAANHNQVMQRIKQPYIALLNDDILLQENALDVLVEYLEQNHDVAIVAPQLQNADSTPQVTVYSDPTLLRMMYKISGLGRFTHQQSAIRQQLIRFGILRGNLSASFKTYTSAQAVDVVKAAAIVVRQSAVEKVGYMDETTKAYGEEVDWNLRMRQNNWQVHIVPQAKITHFGMGQALMQLQGWQIIEDRKAILNYYLKHKPRWQRIIIRTAIVILHAIQAMVSLFTAPKQVNTHLKLMHLGALWRRSTI